MRQYPRRHPLSPMAFAATLLVTGALMTAYAEPIALYVAPNGNDAWSGTMAEPKDGNGPFASLARARVTGSQPASATSLHNGTNFLNNGRSRSKSSRPGRRNRSE